MLFPLDAFPDSLPWDVKRALLVIDLQKDFVEASGKAPIENVFQFLPAIPRLTSKFRENGDVIWVQTEFLQPRPTISPDLGSYTIVLKSFLASDEDGGRRDEDVQGGSPIEKSSADDAPDPGAEEVDAFLAPRTNLIDHSAAVEDLAARSPGQDVRCCLPTTTGVQLPSLLTSAIDHERDIILLKSHYSAFQSSSLLLNLRSKLITDVYLCGAMSNVSVYATALDAVRHGFGVTLVEDCLGYRDERCHEEAMRQMADAMGANGTDCQELIDELNGDLGEVVTEDMFKTKFEVRLPEARRTQEIPSLSPSVVEWISQLHNPTSAFNDFSVDRTQALRDPQSSGVSPDVDGAEPVLELHDTGALQAQCSTVDGVSCGPYFYFNQSSAVAGCMRQVTPENVSPPRKRSTGDISPEQPESKSKYGSAHRRSSHEEAVGSRPRIKATRVRPRRRRDLSGEANSLGIHGRSATSVDRSTSVTPPVDSIEADPRLDNAIPENKASEATQVFDRRVPGAGEAKILTNMATEIVKKRDADKNISPKTLGPGDSIGEGDCREIHNFISSEDAFHAFANLKNEIEWQKMFHRSGEVPRLVAVQGEVGVEGCIPIYRHPADESPQLLPFSPTVRSLRDCLEKTLQQTFNHVLVQLYRSGEDNISEHSDKTLDIVRGSDIVNLSLGAQRTMILRSKAFATRLEKDEVGRRIAQRVTLPHNSLFVLGPNTNRHWLHAIRADKRPLSQKSAEELDFNGERISLTFRHIGTFIEPIKGTIWGQGATSKDQRGAKEILIGFEAQKAGEAMIRAFGQENHQSHGFSWEQQYGTGFDVINSITTDTLSKTG